MCNQHLLGEHRELHAIIGSLLKGIDFSGYIENNLIECEAIFQRHETLVKELSTRGYIHKSPILISEITFEHLPKEQWQYKVNRESSANDLYSRCPLCAWMSYLYYLHGYDLLDAYYSDRALVFNNPQGIYGLRLRPED